MATLGATFGGSYLALRGGGKKAKEQGPPINASNKEEEDFIQYAICAIEQRLVFEKSSECGSVILANYHGFIGNSYRLQTLRTRRQSPSNSRKILGWKCTLLPI